MGQSNKIQGMIVAQVSDLRSRDAERATYNNSSVNSSKFPGVTN